MQSYTNGEMHASQDVGNVGTEERWNVFVWPDGKISLENLSTNHWMTAEGNNACTCYREAPADWEKWQLNSKGDGVSVTLLSAHGRYLCLQPPGMNAVLPGVDDYAGEVVADRTAVGEWETIKMIPSSGDAFPNSWWSQASNIISTAGAAAPILLPLLS